MTRRHPFSRRAFTLVELLVVISIIALLIALLLPALATARSAAQAAACFSNLHQVAVAANAYAGDFDGYLAQSARLEFSAVDGVPEPLRRKGLTNRYTAQPDHYVASEYITFGTNYKGNRGSDAFICPVAVSKLGNIHGLYNGNWGNIESHYYFSDLLTTPGNADHVRKNVVGPYRGSEIDRPSQTYFAGDALADWYTPSYAADFAMHTSMPYAGVYERSGGPGVVTGWSNTGARWTITGENPAMPYHNGGPAMLFFDGHAAAIDVPMKFPTSTTARRLSLRPYTADYTGIDRR